jgi:hypothetical protein
MRLTIFRFFSAKLLAIISLAFLILVNVYAQSPSTRISIALNYATLNEFTQYVEKATGYTFIYDAETRLTHRISIQLNHVPLSKVLKEAFGDEPVSYRIQGRYIYLNKKKATDEGRTGTSNKTEKSKRKYTISGYVTDKESSETLIGANVFELNHQQGTATNSFGFYSVTLPEGDAQISYSYIGYLPRKDHFVLRKDTLINIKLSSNNQLHEVVVTAKDETGILATGMGAIDIPVEQIKHTPTLLGESDMLKTIQLMPGVQSGMSGSAGLYVRGGNADENLILLDGIPVYKVDHVFGFFSVFTPEAMKKVTFFKGSFPARFGGRLSSVIDVRTKDGDMNAYHGNVSIGLLSSRFNIEGPIVKNKTSFCITARRSYLDLMARPFMDSDSRFSYYFYDVNAKINHRFSDKDRLYLSFYQGSDKFHEGDNYDESYASGEKSKEHDDVNMRWGNAISSLRWNHVFSDQLFCNTTVAYNHYGVHLKDSYNAKSQTTTEKCSSIYETNIKDWNFQMDFDYNPVPQHHIKFGGEYLYHDFCPEVTRSKAYLKIDGVATTDTVYKSPERNVYAHEATFYAEDNWKIGDRLQADLGICSSLFSVQKKFYHSFQPRISFRYQWLKDVVLKAAFTQMTQYVHLLTSMPISMPTDLWVPVTKKINPMKSYQYTVGGYYTGIKNWEISTEAYYKNMHNVLEYKDGASFIGFSSNWDDLVEMGKGRAYGIEFMIQKKAGKDTGWLSYTLAKSDRKFSEGGINGGERFPYTYDRRHTLNLVYNHKFSERLDLDATWMFYTGGTATIGTKKSSIIVPDDDYNSEQDINYVPHRNNYRLPSSHTLSIGLNFRKKLKHGGLRTWNVSFYNAYNAMNPTVVYHDEDKTMKLTKFTLLPCIPSVTYSYSF